jgi:hypothetical protein
MITSLLRRSGGIVLALVVLELMPACDQGSSPTTIFPETRGTVPGPANTSPVSKQYTKERNSPDSSSAPDSALNPG